jgi:hypothetical protein
METKSAQELAQFEQVLMWRTFIYLQKAFIAMDRE